jgi:hypothetical protein
MKNRPILIVAITLIIGFVIGFLVNGQITRQRFKSFMNQEYNHAFKHRMMEIIRPDQSQVKEIEPILDEYAEKVQERLRKSKEDMKSLHEEMMEEIEPYLNEHQMLRLKEAQARFERNKNRGHGPKGPPRGGREGNKRYD